MASHDERDVVAVEDARTTARRIVEQVLADRDRKGMSSRADGRVNGDVRSSGSESARRTARRIVDEVLASHASSSSGGEQGRRAVRTRTAAETHDAASDAVSVSEVLVDLTDDHPIATARRIVEQVLAEDRAPEPAHARAGTRSELLTERLFAAVPATVEATVPPPVPGPEPTPDPSPDPMPQPAPDPGPLPDPEPMPEPDPFPPDPEPQPAPLPPEPEPQPMRAPEPPAARGPSGGSAETTDTGGRIPDSPAEAPQAAERTSSPPPAPVPVPPAPVPPAPSPQRRQAQVTARRIVQEVVADHERARSEAEERERAEAARLVEEALVREEVRLAEEARVAEAARLGERRAEADARHQEELLAAAQGEAGPFLAELPHPEGPAAQVDRPPPVPDEVRRGATGSLETLPPPDAHDRQAPTQVLVRGAEDAEPRTGRWLLTTIVGAVALALLFPLAVAALRSLVPVG